MFLLSEKDKKKEDLSPLFRISEIEFPYLANFAT